MNCGLIQRIAISIEIATQPTRSVTVSVTIRRPFRRETGKPTVHRALLNGTSKTNATIAPKSVPIAHPIETPPGQRETIRIVVEIPIEISIKLTVSVAISYGGRRSRRGTAALRIGIAVVIEIPVAVAIEKAPTLDAHAEEWRHRQTWKTFCDRLGLKSYVSAVDFRWMIGNVIYNYADITIARFDYDAHRIATVYRAERISALP